MLFNCVDFGIPRFQHYTHFKKSDHYFYFHFGAEDYILFCDKIA